MWKRGRTKGRKKGDGIRVGKGGRVRMGKELREGNRGRWEKGEWLREGKEGNG